MSQPTKFVLRSSATKDTSPEMGLMLGRALAMDYRKVVVARDYMRSSTMMKEALIAGLMAYGADVIDLGCVSLPVAGMHASKGECAVYVTEYREFGRTSGYLLINSSGGLFRSEQIRRLERILDGDNLTPPVKHVGKLEMYNSGSDEYISKVLSTSTRKADSAVVLDCNCGASAHTAPLILNLMGADLVTMNAQCDRNYTAHSLIPIESDLRDLRQFIGSDPGTIGFALNRIGNLVSVLDEQGSIIRDEVVLALLIMFLRPKRIVVPMNMTSLVKEAFFGRIKVKMKPWVPVKDPEELEFIMVEPNSGTVCSAVNEKGAEMGFYEGGYIFSNVSCSPDAIHATCLVSQLAVDNSLKDLVEALPEYYSEEKTLRVSISSDEFRRNMDDRSRNLGSVISNSYGWRVDLDHGWFMVSRDRNDPENAVLFGESEDKAYLVSMMEVATDLLMDCTKGR
jgi:phosphomannomutase